MKITEAVSELQLINKAMIPELTAENIIQPAPITEGNIGNCFPEIDHLIAVSSHGNLFRGRWYHVSRGKVSIDPIVCFNCGGNNLLRQAHEQGSITSDYITCTGKTCNTEWTDDTHGEISMYFGRLAAMAG